MPTPVTPPSFTVPSRWDKEDTRFEYRQGFLKGWFAAQAKVADYRQIPCPISSMTYMGTQRQAAWKAGRKDGADTWARLKIPRLDKVPAV